MTDPDVSRRRALTGAAALGVGVPLLAACGGNNTSSAAGQTRGDTKAPSGGSSSGGSGSTPGLVATADVPVGGGVLLRDQNLVVTQPKKGEFKAFSATCTHQGCQVASVAAGTINCPCHGSQFSITDGSNVTGPSGTPAGSIAPLSARTVRVKGTEVVEG